MANLAIRGHKIRGKEVIEILEMLGGVNKYEISDTNVDLLYTIRSHDKFIIGVYPTNTFVVFTLEEFLKKFPYKVGDRVRVPEYESEVRISKMYWDGNEVQYEVVTDEVEWYSAKELNKFNEPNKPDKEKKINQMSLANCDLDEVEIVLGDKFELKIREGKYYAIRKKLQYPKTYEECKASGFSSNPVIVAQVQGIPITTLAKLIVIRNEYWKIYGEQMGLGKPWEPDWDDENEFKYGLYHFRNGIMYDGSCINPTLLAFPTAEMRDVFYENFKDLIEQCKDLL